MFFYPPSSGISSCVRTGDMPPHLAQPCCVALGRALDSGLVSRLVFKPLFISLLYKDNHYKLEI